jgi:nucleotide-binding universal stress UspA family protein
MTKILIPVDFSETSSNALWYAIRLFGKEQTQLTVMHTFRTPKGTFQMKSIDHILERDANDDMERLISSVKEQEPEVLMDSKILKSDSVSAITSVAKAGNYDFIVMGTKGASGLKEVFLGSVAGGVISKSEIPVLVIPHGAEFKEPKEVCLALGNMPLSDPAVLSPLGKILKLYSASLDILHIREDEEPDISEVLNTLEEFKPSVTYATSNGNINKLLREHVESNEVSILSLVRGKKGFFDRLVSGSVTLKQTFSSTVPLLILQN